MYRPRTRTLFGPSGRRDPYWKQPSGRGPGLAGNGMGRTGRKRATRAARMALKG